MNALTRKLSATFFSATVMFAVPACAQQDSSVATASEVAAEEAQVAAPALWKIADEDTTIYLFGTVHALPKDVEWITSPIENALAESGSIVTEIKMGPEMAQQMQSLVMSKGVLPQGTTLRSLMDEEQLASYETAMGKLGLPAPAFDQFEPWYAGMMMSMLPLLQQGYSPDAGVEQVILACAGGKEQRAIETLEYQISIFEELPQAS